MTSFSDSLPLSQRQTPLLDILAKLAKQSHAAFYAPGHKRGQGISHHLVDLWGKAVFQADLPELPELDNLFSPEGVIKEAQALAAEAFQASQTWFLVNGSTCGVITAILATCQTGDKIILPRNIHQSAIAGLILSGAIPIFLNPVYHPELDLAYSITPESLSRALKQHPDAKALMMVYPTYHGICGDLETMISITHQYSIPLIVDEAHGAHFTFHPQLPPSALSLGADLVIQSSHKVLGALTQASMLHLQGTRVNPQRISQALQFLQTSSPSYLLLASLDAARQQMALQGKELLSKTLDLADYARNQLKQITGLSVLELDYPQPGFKALDQTRLTVNVTQLGLTGYDADALLHQQLGVTAELPSLKNLTFILTFGNTLEDIEQLIEGFKSLSLKCRQSQPSWLSCPVFPLEGVATVSPREAFFSRKITLSIPDSIGYLSGELICPYPPGIPVLMPGEIITQEAIAYLQQVTANGANLTGCSDPTFQTLQVIDPPVNGGGTLRTLNPEP